MAFLSATACGGGPEDNPGRLPPGQTWTDRFPVYSAFGDQHIDTADWSLALTGLVERDTTLDWQAFRSLPAVTDTLDFHCVTSWSRRGDIWRGVPSSAILDLARPLPGAAAVMIHCADGYTTNLTLADFSAEGVMLAFEFAGAPLEPEHGFPVRLLVPHLYAYKAAKWVTGIEFLAEDTPGFWEQRGYSSTADPWTEDRYSR